jgi:hypothetical protein
MAGKANPATAKSTNNVKNFRKPFMVCSFGTSTDVSNSQAGGAS